MNYLNLEFIDPFYKYQIRKVVSFNEQFNKYMVTRPGLKSFEFLSDEEIQEYLNEQNNYKSQIEKEKIEEENKIIEQQEEQTKQQLFNNWIKNKTELQQGRIKKHMIEGYTHYRVNSKTIKALPNYLMVEYWIKEGYEPLQLTNVKYYSKRSGVWNIKKNIYRLHNENTNSFVDVSKTQFDYANYLLNYYKGE